MTDRLFRQQPSRHAMVRQQINLFSQFLDSIRELLTEIEISQKN